MDDVWIYGNAPQNIYHSIVEGRPNGMPSFGGKVPQEQLWEIVAYVRSLSGLPPLPTEENRLADFVDAEAHQVANAEGKR